jgi:hypothetical protein
MRTGGGIGEGPPPLPSPPLASPRLPPFPRSLPRSRPASLAGSFRLLRRSCWPGVGPSQFSFPFSLATLVRNLVPLPSNRHLAVRSIVHPHSQFISSGTLARLLLLMLPSVCSLRPDSEMHPRRLIPSQVPSSIILYLCLARYNFITPRGSPLHSHSCHTLCSIYSLFLHPSFLPTALWTFGWGS